ncbi:hypothetical protein GS597_05035 [Synechococcales cyanobacterium C]|uniref:Uncharacterized protein n=1 Tax=Petrachloros mirabilis ULC683 TaxID=2781853 RepID=A0A8K2A7E7_9CYAN|nr:hypothetical protein [Petrachloros mirabilis]NCJ05885.1 hypothetical protein [Petrachloros mirabilis ULC683]
MLSPDDIIGQKVWLTVARDPDFPDMDPYRVKAEITQPTAPPWFFARYEDAPIPVREVGKWLSLYEAQQVVLMDPVLEDYDWEDEDWDDEISRDQMEFS